MLLNPAFGYWHFSLFETIIYSTEKKHAWSPVFKILSRTAMSQLSQWHCDRAMMVPLSLFLKNDSNTVIAKWWSDDVINYACAGECTLHRFFCCIALAYPHDVVTNHAKRYILLHVLSPLRQQHYVFPLPWRCVCVCVCVVLLSSSHSMLAEILMRLKVNKVWLWVWQVFILLFYHY